MGLFDGVTGYFGTAPADGQVAPVTAVDANGVPVEEKKDQNAEQLGGGRRRKMKKQCGGSFHPYTPSDSASTASVFKGGRRRRTRKSRKVHRKSHKKSYRKKR